MRTKFQEIENTVDDRVKKILDKLKTRTITKRLQIFDNEDECVEDGKEDYMSMQFLRNQQKIS